MHRFEMARDEWKPSFKKLELPTSRRTICNVSYYTPLKLTASLPLENRQTPQRKLYSVPTIHFHVLLMLVSGRVVLGQVSKNLVHVKC